MKINTVLNEAPQRVAIIFGRFNPPHYGHKAAWATASKFDQWFVGTNKSTIGEKDPLPYEVKIEAMKAVWPEVADHIMTEQSWFTMASKVYEQFGPVVLIVVTDETDKDWIMPVMVKNNGAEGPHGYYNFPKIVWQKAARISSATDLRGAVAKGDKEAFEKAAGVSADTPVAGSTFYEVVSKYLMPYLHAKAEKERIKAARDAAKAAKTKKESVTEMDSQGYTGSRDKKSVSKYGSRDNYELGKGKERTAKMTTADKMMKDAHDAMMRSMSDADKIKKGWRNPNMKEQGVAEGWKDKAASAALAGTMALGSPAHAGPIGNAVAQGLGAGIASAAVSSVANKSRNARDTEFAKQIPDEADRAIYLKALKHIKYSRAIAHSDPALMGANAVSEIKFKKLKQAMAEKYNIQMPVKEQGVKEEKQRLDPKCWDGYKKQGTKMKGGVRVNNCVKESFTPMQIALMEGGHSLYEDASTLNIGDPVIITGKGIEFEGTTGEIVDFGQDKKFVVVNLYNHGKHSFHSSDVGYNDYADSDEEEARMYDHGEFRDDFEESSDKVAGRYDPEEFDDLVKRVGQRAKQGPMKTVWDPVKRVYKNVPVKQDSEEVDEASLATMRKYFAGDTDAKDQTKLAQMRDFFNKNRDQFSDKVVKKEFNSLRSYEQWLEKQGMKKVKEDDESAETQQNKNLIPFPAGTTKVDVGGDYDWYKLGMVISDLDDADPSAFGKGPASAMIAFGSEDEEHKYKDLLSRLGMKIHDIDQPQEGVKIIPASKITEMFRQAMKSKKSK